MSFHALIRALKGSKTLKICGAKEIRTPDLFDANEALYQLSYSPGVLRNLRGTASRCGTGDPRLQIISAQHQIFARRHAQEPSGPLRASALEDVVEVAQGALCLG